MPGYPLAGRRLDDGFFDVVVENDGLVHARLSRPDGFVVDLWAEPVFAFWQVYTGDKRAAAYARRGIAVEPMTAAPNAFNNHQGLLILAPGESFSAAWGVTLRPADADGRA
jgi:aldose 1-epimerase